MTIKQEKKGLQFWHLILIVGCFFSGGMIAENRRTADTKPAIANQVREDWIEKCALEGSCRVINKYNPSECAPYPYAEKYTMCADAWDRVH